MKRILIALFALALVPASALAQKGETPKGWGYGFGAIGKTSGDFGHTTVHVGGGGEGLFYKGLGAGGEIGYLTTSRSTGMGVASANVVYHFVRPGQKVVPFVTGGASLFFRSGAVGGANVGGGIQYWVKDRVALRFEFRDHIVSSDSPHFYGFRVGIAFR